MFTENYQLLNYLIDKLKYKNYIEIGQIDDDSLANVNIENKSYIHLSRNYDLSPKEQNESKINESLRRFLNYNKNQYDIIYINALYLASDIIKIIQNLLDNLSNSGCIVIKNTLPIDYGMQEVPRKYEGWTGDIWKAIPHLRRREDLDIYTLEIKFGTTVIFKSSNMNKTNIGNEYYELDYSKLYGVFKTAMNVVSFNAFENMLDRKTKKQYTTLLTQFYQKESRKEDNLICLMKNIENKNIDQIVLFFDNKDYYFKVYDFVSKMSEKIKLHLLDRRATYQDFFDYCNSELINNICIIANTDIYFNHTIENLRSVNFDNLFLCISRMEATDCIKPWEDLALSREGSQDAWIFKAPVRINTMSPVLLGYGGCENRIAYEAYNEGYVLKNPYRIVNAMHVHRNKVMDWAGYAEGPYKFVPPTDELPYY